MGTKTLEDCKAEYAAGLPEDTQNRERKILLNSAKNYLRGVVNDLEGDLKDAVRALIGNNKRSTNTSRKIVHLHVLVEKGEMSNFDCFKEFNKGPAEMRELMRYGVKSMPAEERVWIEFDESRSMYVVASVGPEAPQGWAWYFPDDAVVASGAVFDDEEEDENEDDSEVF